MTKFSIIIDMLKIAFSEPIDENDYNTILVCLREYAENRESLENEMKVNESNGYPIDYNPCDHMERIRFCIVFGSIPNSKIKTCLWEWNSII